MQQKVVSGQLKKKGETAKRDRERETGNGRQRTERGEEYE